MIIIALILLKKLCFALEEEETHTNQVMRLAAEAGNDKELLQLIKQNGLVTDPVNDDGSTLLHIAAIKGQLRKEILYHNKSGPLCVHLYLLWSMLLLCC